MTLTDFQAAKLRVKVRVSVKTGWVSPFVFADKDGARQFCRASDFSSDTAAAKFMQRFLAGEHPEYPQPAEQPYPWEG